MISIYLFYHKKLMQRANKNNMIKVREAKDLIRLRKNSLISKSLAYDILRDLQHWGLIKIIGRQIQIIDLSQIDKELYEQCKGKGWFK